LNLEAAMPTAKPSLKAPSRACDCHVHIYDPAMPLAPTALGSGPAWASVTAYRAVQARLGISRVVVVQPTAYGTNNGATVAAIIALGRDDARGVVVVDAGVSEAELERLTQAGIRGVRFQMLPGGVLPWETLEPVAAKIAPFGWHIQLQMDGRLLPEREAMLARLPCTLVIDHVGKFLEPVTPGHPGFKTLLRLLERDRCWLKLTAPYEVSKAGPPLYPDVGALAKAAARHRPDRMVWATNWPHVAVKELPDDPMLLDLLLDWVPDEATRTRILVDNPATLYGFS
jgi:D-galactarolactone isomerase